MHYMLMCEEIQKLLVNRCHDKHHLYFLLINEELTNIIC